MIQGDGQVLLVVGGVCTRRANPHDEPLECCVLPVQGVAAAPGPTDRNALITGAARDLAEYQRLTAEGKLGEAGQKLEHLKHELDELNARPR